MTLLEILMRSRRLTVVALSHDLGCSEMSVHRWLTGAVRPSFQFTRELEKKFGHPINELLSALEISEIKQEVHVE